MTSALAPTAPPAAPSQTMARKRTPGTTNAPGGAWYSTPNDKRKSPVRRFTLDAEALAALAFLAPDEGMQSAMVREALVTLAKARGWRP